MLFDLFENMGSKTSRQSQHSDSILKNDILNLFSELNTTDLSNENALKSIMMRFDILLVRCRKREYMYFTRTQGYCQEEAQRKIRQRSPEFFFHKEPGLEPPRYDETIVDIEPELSVFETFQQRHIHIVKYLEFMINT
jgi:hypothetical protein